MVKWYKLIISPVYVCFWSGIGKEYIFAREDILFLVIVCV